jgi:L-rhamnose mutarotase
MERFVWKGRVAEGKLEEYAKKHQEIWPEMEELMRRAGMRNYSIWNCGNELIGYYEYLGMDKKMAAYNAEKQILDRWNKHMEGLMEMDRDENGNVMNWSRIWLME